MFDFQDTGKYCANLAKLLYTNGIFVNQQALTYLCFLAETIDGNVFETKSLN